MHNNSYEEAFTIHVNLRRESFIEDQIGMETKKSKKLDHDNELNTYDTPMS